MKNWIVAVGIMLSACSFLNAAPRSGGFSSSSSRSFSSPSRSFSSPSRSYSSPSRSFSSPSHSYSSPSRSSSSSSRSYSSPSKSSSSGSSFFSSGSSSSSRPIFGSSASSSSSKKPTYSSTTRTYSSKTGQSVTGKVTHIDKPAYKTSTVNVKNFYGSHYSNPYPVYHDSFSPFLMGWMLSSAMNTHDRALWMYHHADNMDQMRYQTLIDNDSSLKAEIEKLKAENLKKDPNYVPEKMKDDPGLMYNQDKPVVVKPAQPFWTPIKIIGLLFCLTIGLGLVFYTVNECSKGN